MSTFTQIETAAPDPTSVAKALLAQPTPKPRPVKPTCTPAKPLTTGLVLLTELGVTGAIIKCYSCGKRITDATMGAVVYEWDEDEAEPIFLCKGEDVGYTDCLNSPIWKKLPWQQLDGFLSHLLWNVGIRTTRQFKTMMDGGDRDMRV